MSFRSPKLLKAAKGQACVNCDSMQGVVACHSNLYEHGKGIGIKAHDVFHAHLCRACHAALDGRERFLTKEEKRDFFYRMFARTILRLFEQGIVSVK